VDGIKRTELTLSSDIDDSSNSNPLYFGGQVVDPSHSQGDLYSETDVVMARQTWLTRALSRTEMVDYDQGSDFGDGAVVFNAVIQEQSPDACNFYDSVSSTYATVGNTPERVLFPEQ
jgi:hypothetical protein